MTITLPCFGIIVTLNTDGTGTVTSELTQRCDCFTGMCDGCFDNAIMGGIESLILAHALAGVNIEELSYIAGILEAVAINTRRDDV